MSEFVNLNAEEQAKVDGKLVELQVRTDQVWSCEVTKTPEGQDSISLLEITVDGRIAKPVVLDHDAHQPADRICRELDEFYASRPATPATV